MFSVLNGRHALLIYKPGREEDLFSELPLQTSAGGFGFATLLVFFPTREMNVSVGAPSRKDKAIDHEECKGGLDMVGGCSAT